MSPTRQRRKTRGRFLAAVVLGSALAALGSASSASAAETSGRVVSDVGRYCSACWRNARLPVDRWGDCTQEVFQRLLQRLPLSHWHRLWTQESLERLEFLRAIDAVKKRAQRDRKHSGFASSDHPDRPAIVAARVAEERAAVALASVQVLSPRQQRIIKLTCEGWSIPEMAEELKLAPQRVSDEKYKAIQKLRTHFDDRC